MKEKNECNGKRTKQREINSKKERKKERITERSDTLHSNKLAVNHCVCF